MSENGTGKLLPRQYKAIEGLLSGKTASQAATYASVGRSTLYRWLNTDPAFKAALSEAEAGAIAELSRQLVTLARDATAVLAHTLADAEAGPGHKLRAAGLILENLLRLRELAVIEQRLSALETKANEKH